ncbi:phage tail tape measure C-terminal domain-containing protein [Hyphomonas sp.]|uniref:phage tail tape measure C-terminal domain-containing protein n=1 Tax=Hyphomonas sp. TaxID=87 RepID=UPI00391A6F22
MTGTEYGLDGAARALNDLAARPGRQAADALAEAFGQAGERITVSLNRAARTGELDFQRMAESMLRDIARVAAEALILRNSSGSSVSASFNFAPGTDERSALGQSGSIAALLARLVQGGGRFL